MRRLITIDPGKTGAWAVFDLDTGELRGVFEFPIIEHNSLAWVDAKRFTIALKRATEGADAVVGLVEQITPNPKNGMIAAFSQGQTLVSPLCALQLLDARIEFVTPQKWKGALGLIRRGVKLTDTERKNASLSKARLLYPNAPLELQKHHNRAEAILLGHWYFSNRLAAKAA